VLYGEDIAILAGDALLSTAFEHVARETPKDVVSADTIVELIVRLGKCVCPVGLAGGQVMDLQCEGKANVTLDDLRWIHTHKTAALLQAAVACGALIGGATPSQIQACETFALDIGLAFQVADDILDVTATSEELGKTAGKDLSTDKTTYPKLLGLDQSRLEAQRLVDEAKAALKPFGSRAAPLLGIADYIKKRYHGSCNIERIFAELKLYDGDHLLKVMGKNNYFISFFNTLNSDHSSVIFLTERYFLEHNTATLIFFHQRSSLIFPHFLR